MTIVFVALLLLYDLSLAPARVEHECMGSDILGKGRTGRKGWFKWISCQDSEGYLFLESLYK